MAYTFKRIVQDTKDVTKQRRIVTVEFEDGADLISETKEFSLDFSEAGDKVVRREFTRFLNALNEEVTPITDVTYTPDPEPTPDASQVAFENWQSDLQMLVAIKVGTALGLDAATTSQINALTNQVQAGLNGNRNDVRYVSALASYANLL